MPSERKKELLSLNTNRLPPQPAVSQCMLSHDMNNCLAIILGECDLLFDLLDNPEALQRLMVIDHTARRMSNDIKTRPCPTRL